MNAPDSSSCMFWAATRTALPRDRSTTSLSARKGGQMTTSCWVAAIRGSSASTNSAASATVLFIFQLAASKGVRVSGIAQRLHSGQVFSLQ